MKNRPESPEFEELPPLSPLIDINWTRTILVIVFLALIGYGAFKSRGLYEQWRHSKLMAQIQFSMREKDYAAALLSARQLLQTQPASLDATRAMAEISEIAGSPESVLWRGRMAELTSDSKDILAWASTALKFGEGFIADQALTRLPEESRSGPEYHKLAAGLALSNRHVEIAEGHFAAAAELEPDNEMTRYNLAAVRLQSPDADKVRKAREVLESMLEKPGFEPLALRALVADAQGQGDHQNALLLSGRLVETPGATFKDHISRLGALRSAGHADFKTHLKGLQQAAAGDNYTAYEMILWMCSAGMAGEAIDWSRTLPHEVALKQPVPQALAEAFVLTEDWAALRGLVINANWHDLEFLRCAYHARALRETDQLLLSRTELQPALSQVRDNPKLTPILAELLEKWGWYPEAEQLWLSASEEVLGQRNALKGLYRIYAAGKETRKLFQLSRRILELDPSDRIAKNNFAMLSLLLAAEMETAHRCALENYKEFPANPAFASTYAYSLWVQKRHDESLKVIQSLPESVLKSPSFALIYALLLAENGHKEKAVQYAALAEKNSGMLHEEANLLWEARQKAK